MVGPQGAEVHTDAWGRIKVRPHYDEDKRGSENSSLWVRVSSAWAGLEFGSQHVPRIGDEVLLSFEGGDPDRPVVTGRVVNEGRASPWDLPTQHALSGFRSRELGGSSRSNHLVMDDTPKQIQTQLSSDHQLSQLNLGYLTRIADRQGRKDGRGEGFELRTDAHGVVRAGAGMLLTTESRPEAQGHHKDMSETIERLANAQHDLNTTGELSQHHEAHEGEQQQVAQALQGQHEELRGSGGTNGEFVAPHIVLASPAGIASTTPKTTHVHSGEHIALNSGKHTSVSTLGGFFVSAAKRVSLVAHSLGMKLIAASGHLELQAQNGDLRATAKRTVHLRSLGDIVIEAEKGIVLKVGNTYQRITPEQIVDGMKGARVVHAGDLSVIGPDGMAPDPISLPHSDFDQEVFLHHKDGKPAINRKFRLTHSDGSVVEGTTDHEGRTRLAKSLTFDSLIAEIL